MSGETIAAGTFLKAVARMADTIEAQQDYLSELDSALGDGDHGVGMTTAFRAVRAKLPGLEGKDIGTILKTTGMAILSAAGGAMGPLYGTAFMRAGKVAEGKEMVTLEELAAMAQAARAGLVERGKAEVGEKTMLDTIHPAVEALVAAVRDGSSLAAALGQCERAAQAGMESTKDLVSRRGRSSRLGERTLGHIDPGAASSFLLIRAFCEALTA